MKKMLIAALAATTALTGAMASGLAAAQPHDQHDHGPGGPGGPGRGGPGPGHGGPGPGHGGPGGHQWRYYGGQYGYSGYRGRWRTGQRYPHWRDHRYRVDNWRAYDLPPPRPGYAYYRDPNGDIVMAAIASGVIGLIVGGALAH